MRNFPPLKQMLNILRAYVPPVFLKPNFVSLQLEDRCCFRCLQCDIWKKEKTTRRLTLPQIKKIILELKDWLGFYQLNLAGGEPLMNKNTLPTIKFASESGVFVHLNTNGFLVTDKMAKGLVKSGLGSLSFSLDSLKEKTHDRIRVQKGAFLQLRRAVDCILKYKKGKKDPAVSLTTIILKQNLSELPEMVDFVKKMGLDAIYFQPLWHNFGADVYDRFWYKDSPLWPDDYKSTKQGLALLVEMKKKKYPIGNSLFELEEYISYFANPLEYGKEKTCWVGTNSFNIGLDGQVRLCFDLEPIGDILKKTPGEIWNGRQAQRLRQSIAKCQRGCKVLLCNMPLNKREANNFLHDLNFDKLKKGIVRTFL